MKNSTEDNRRAVIEAAYETDCVPHGYWGNRTDFSKNIEKELELLQNSDKNAWAKFLFNLKDEHDFKEFKSLSPFADKFVVAVNYGCGFVNLHGDIVPFVDSLIHNRLGWKTYDCDQYVLVLDKPNEGAVDGFWVRCGICGIKGPRAAE